MMVQKSLAIQTAAAQLEQPSLNKPANSPQSQQISQSSSVALQAERPFIEIRRKVKRTVIISARPQPPHIDINSSELSVSGISKYVNNGLYNYKINKGPPSKPVDRGKPCRQPSVSPVKKNYVATKAKINGKPNQTKTQPSITDYYGFLGEGTVARREAATQPRRQESSYKVNHIYQSLVPPSPRGHSDTHQTAQYKKSLLHSKKSVQNHEDPEKQTKQIVELYILARTTHNMETIEHESNGIERSGIG